MTTFRSGYGGAARDSVIACGFVGVLGFSAYDKARGGFWLGVFLPKCGGLFGLRCGSGRVFGSEGRRGGWLLVLTESRVTPIVPRVLRIG